MASTLQPQDYQVAIICALGTESNAVQGIFDELYDPKDITWRKAPDDRNAYTLGRIGRHHVVLAHMSGMGKVTASIAARDIRATFPNISRGLALVVGVCGGAPQTPQGDDIFLGDIVIATEIQQADFGREYPHGFVMKEHSEGNLGPAPSEIKAFLHRTSSREGQSRLLHKTACFASELSSGLDIEPPDLRTDKLFPTDYLHKHQDTAQQQCQTCGKDSGSVCLVSQSATCTQLHCSAANTRLRGSGRPTQQLAIYFGPICSTDTVKRSGISRDNYVKQYKALAFEMEGAGVWNTLPTIVVKAVCDYADSHKNKKWQEYAAVNAAACCKALVDEWIPLALGAQLHLAKLAQPQEQLSLRKAYLASLEYAQLNSRLHDIKFPQPGTCDWIFESSEFRSWLDRQAVDHHHGVLWIKGKPGSGKSVIMKHIYQANKFFKGHTVVGYFFHARGVELQQTLNGMLRGLLYKLLTGNSQLLNHFIAEYPMHAEEDIQNRIWANSELQDFLFRSIRNAWLGETVLMVDALDECDHTDARELVSFCEDLALEAIHSKIRILICFSIRHFPNISMRKCEQLTIDNRKEHDADIRKYAIRKLLVQELVPEILRKAQHIFLWIVLVVQILNAYHDKGSDLPTMHAVLGKIPAGLQAVFDLLLQNDSESSEETEFMLQLALHSTKPFSPRAMYTIVTASTRPDWKDLVASDTMNDKALRLFIISKSKGLLELSAGLVDGLELPSTSDVLRDEAAVLPWQKQERYVVQFIHESVVDYLKDSRQAAQLEQSPLSPSAEAFHIAIAQAYLKILDSGTSVTTYNKQTYSSASELFRAKAIAEAYNYAESNALGHIMKLSDLGELNRLLKEYSDLFVLKSKGSTEDLLTSVMSHERRMLQNTGSETHDDKSKSQARLEAIIKAVIQIDHKETYMSNNNSEIRRNKWLYADVLMIAFRNRWYEIVEVLVEGGAQIPLEYLDYANALNREALEDIVHELAYDQLNGMVVEDSDTSSEAEEQALTLLHKAILFNQTSMVRRRYSYLKRSAEDDTEPRSHQVLAKELRRRA